MATTTRTRIATVETVELPDGRRLTARRWRGRGRPLVLLHGLLDSSEGWTATCSHMRRTCIAFDLPGFGDSDLAPRPRISAFADDVLHALRALDVGEHTLVGHSLGGAVAAALAERNRAGVASMALLAPAGFGRIHLAEAISVPGMRHVIERSLPLALRSRLAVGAAYSAVVANGLRADPALVDRVVTRGSTLVAGARDATRAVVAAGLSKDAFHKRGLRYDGPIVAVWGDRDRLVPLGHTRGLERAAPQAEIIVFAGMGHHPQRERPLQLAQILERVATLGGRGVTRSRAARPAHAA